MLTFERRRYLFNNTLSIPYFVKPNLLSLISTMQSCFNKEGLILVFAKLFSGKYLIQDQMSVTFHHDLPL